jgi:hypothetical protein
LQLREQNPAYVRLFPLPNPRKKEVRQRIR